MDGPGPCDNMVMAGTWRTVHGKTEVDEAHGGDSRKEKLNILVTFSGGERLGSRRNLHHGHPFLDGRRQKRWMEEEERAWRKQMEVRR